MMVMHDGMMVRPVQGGRYGNMKEASSDYREGATKAVSVDEEGEEHGEGESARSRSRETEGIGARSFLVKISRGENDSRSGGETHPRPGEQAEGEEKRLEVGHEGGEGHPGEGKQAAAETDPAAIESLAESRSNRSHCQSSGCHGRWDPGGYLDKTTVANIWDEASHLNGVWVETHHLSEKHPVRFHLQDFWYKICFSFLFSISLEINIIKTGFIRKNIYLPNTLWHGSMSLTRVHAPKILDCQFHFPLYLLFTCFYFK